MAKKYYQGYGTMSKPVPTDGLVLTIDDDALGALTQMLQRLRLEIAKNFPYILEEVLYELDYLAEGFVKNLIEESHESAAYKAFMIPRTQVKIEHTAMRARIVVSGITEDKLGAAGKGGNYNIWAVQEFGYSFGEITPKNPDAAGYGRFNFGFNKDTGGGIIARMKTIPARVISKNKGVIAQLIHSHEVQLRMQIALSGDMLIKDWLQRRITTTAKEIGLEVRGAIEHSGFLQTKGIDPAQLKIAGIKSIETFATGQTVFRGGKGQFVTQKLGGASAVSVLGSS